MAKMGEIVINMPLTACLLVLLYEYVGFPSQLKKGVDKHHLFLDLCCHLSRDSRGLILEVKSERAFAHITITFMK